MKNYTTRTAALKATTIDARILDTKILKINGETFDPSDSRVKVWRGKWGDGTFNTCDANDTGVWCSENIFWNLHNVYGVGYFPYKLFINGHEVMCKMEEDAHAWDFYVAQPGDNLSEIYGGITNDTPVTIYYSLR
jgi:hypothetical protein